jgi:hypothetical protein
VAFTAGGARVVVCGHCQTVVAREGAELVGRGTVAALVDSDSALRLGLEGRYGGVPFRLVGHLQRDRAEVEGPSTPWDEWYLELEDGRRAWLAESEGELHLLFFAGEQPHARRASLRPGSRVKLPDGVYAVEELRRSRLVGAAGQLPSDVSAEGAGWAADLTAEGGRFATLDFGAQEEGAELFLGRRVEPAELALDTSGALPPKAPAVRLQQARCTQCNGPLELRAPDSTRRVACPFCNSLLDVSRGRLSFLQALEPPPVLPAIPLGARGRLAAREWTAIGFQVRSCRVEGTRYPWTEYLLYRPPGASGGGPSYSFLLESNGHWTHLLPVPAGEVAVRPGTLATYQGRRYRPFQAVTAVTETVLGEFYWEVRAGDTAEAAEYVAPPLSLSEERTEEEVTYSHGTYLAPAEVQRAFGLEKPLPPPTGIAPSQPNPGLARARSAAGWAGLYAALGLLVFLLASARAAREVVLEQSVPLAEGATGGSPEAVHFSAPFEVRSRGNVRAELSADVENGWLGVQGDLVNEETGEVRSFYEEVSSYRGVEDGEAWSEGGREETEYLSSVPPGRYVLRTTPFFDGRAGGGRPAAGYAVRLTSDVPRVGWLLALWVALGLLALLSRWRAASFESRRWAESSFGQGGDA